MSVDERLRSALRDQADTYVPRVETALERVRSRGRAARWRTAAMASLGTVAAAAAVVGALAWVEVSGPADTQPAGEPSSAEASTAPAPLRGEITSDVVAPGRLRGPWVLQLNGNGTMDVRPPAGYSGMSSDALFTADGTTFRTTLFQTDLCAGDGTGIYDWLSAGDRIDFGVVSDPCPARVRFFEKSVWTLSTSAAPQG